MLVVFYTRGSPGQFNEVSLITVTKIIYTDNSDNQYNVAWSDLLADIVNLSSAIVPSEYTSEFITNKNKILSIIKMYENKLAIGIKLIC